MDSDSDTDSNYGRNRRDQFSSFKNATIYLIDGSSSMFVEKPLPEESDSAFDVALKCSLKSLKSMIFGSPRDLFSVIIYGLSPERTPTMGKMSQYEGVHILTELSRPDLAAISGIENLLRDSLPKGIKVSSKDSSNSSSKLAEGFWLCSKLLDSAGKNVNSTVLLFTADSEPQMTREERKQAELRASDLMDAGTRIEVVGLSQQFDFLPFYKDLVVLPGEEESENLWKPPTVKGKLDTLLNQVVTLSRSRRPRAKINFQIGENFQIAVGIYALVRGAYLPKKVKLDRRTNEVLETVTTKYTMGENLEDITAEELGRSDIIKYQEFGGARIRLRVDEHRHLRRLGDPGLFLLGFKPKDMIKRHWFHRPCDFIYPEENIVKGSRSFFVALLERLQVQNKVAICRMIANSNSVPSLVALIPQEEVIDESGSQDVPPGFHVFYLPFADDVRDLNIEELTGDNPAKASDEEVIVAKKIIRKLEQKGGYKPELFQNPVLRKMWINIESMALDKDPEDFFDSTVVPPEIIDQRIGPLVEELSSLVTGKVGKRSFADGEEEQGSFKHESKKKMKLEGMANIENMILEGHAPKLTVAQLKEFLALNNAKIPSKAKKSDLIDLAMKAVGLSD
ncbi:hypothetical protein QYM36_012730 [Artemia franciscana]|uniref:ATP-dependent DNA helicase 2 subunit 1 n=2 Tax=Artemia franciscana TaxID=6661 RepID=A0AA88HWT6_ARTSF|nr:hypothetical protein QYM36_012730 [Artemia franciscana]